MVGKKTVPDIVKGTFRIILKRTVPMILYSKYESVLHDKSQ